MVLDSWAFVAVLTDGGPSGDWVASRLVGASVAAPALGLFECANVLRRLELTGRLDPSEAALAHEDLLAMAVEWWPYEPLAARARELRASIAAYDASYIAWAEAVGAPLLTLDVRLARATGPRCPVLTPT